jgi:hypothetical protein
MRLLPPNQPASPRGLKFPWDFVVLQTAVFGLPLCWNHPCDRQTSTLWQGHCVEQTCHGLQYTTNPSWTVLACTVPLNPPCCWSVWYISPSRCAPLCSSAHCLFGLHGRSTFQVRTTYRNALDIRPMDTPFQPLHLWCSVPFLPAAMMGPTTPTCICPPALCNRSAAPHWYLALAALGGAAAAAAPWGVLAHAVIHAPS